MGWLSDEADGFQQGLATPEKKEVFKKKKKGGGEESFLKQT